MDTALDERHAIGANKPPEPDPFEAWKAHIDDLYEETKLWADGQEIETQAQADDVDRLIDMIKEAIDGAEAARDEEIVPLTKQVTTIRERWYPLIADTTKITGKAIRAKKALLAVKTVWGNKVRAQQAIEAQRLRDAAAEQARQAAEAAREAVGDLQATEAAEDLIRDAQSTLRAAQRAEKPIVKGMRTVWIATMIDPVAAARWAWERHRPECEAYFLKLAEADVRDGRRTIPGFSIKDDKVAV